MRKIETNTTTTHIRLVKAIEEELENLYLHVNADWAIASREPAAADPEMFELGLPGLWKRVTSKRCPLMEFAVPLYVVDQMTSPDDEQADARFHCLRRMVKWAADTVNGTIPSTWKAPTLDELTRWIGPELLTVQCADVASQGEILRADNRLAVRFPIVAGIPETLSPARRDKLTALLTDAHNTWHMTRIGLRNDGNSQTAYVEVDLTGAPFEAVESLLRFSVDAMHHIVRWCGASATLIISETKCELLDL